MAYIEKRIHTSGRATYRVRIRVNGSPNISESFPTRRAAKEWSDKMEADVRQGRYFGRTESKERTFAELVDRYIQQSVPSNPKSNARETALSFPPSTASIHCSYKKWTVFR